MGREHTDRLVPIRAGVTRRAATAVAVMAVVASSAAVTGASAATGMGTGAWGLGTPVADAAPAKAAAAAVGAPSGPVWSPATGVGPSDPGAPALTVNGSGQAAVGFGYTTTHNPVGTIYVSSSATGSAWKPAVAVPGSSSYDSRGPSMALDRAGNLTTVYMASQIDGLSSGYAEESQSAQGVWGNAVVLETPLGPLPGAVRVTDAPPASPTTVAMVPIHTCGLLAVGEAVVTGECVKAFDFALDPSGYGAATWRTASGALGVATRTPAKVWSAPVGLVPRGAMSAAVAVDTAGTTTVAYTVAGSVGRTLQVREVTEQTGRRWGPSTQLAAAACTSSVAVSRTTKTALVAFTVPGHASCDAGVSLATAGGLFAAPALLTAGAHVSALVSTATPAGSFLLAWDSSGGVYATTSASAGFAVPTKLGAPGAPAVAAGGGSGVVGWCNTQCLVSSTRVS